MSHSSDWAGASRSKVSRSSGGRVASLPVTCPQRGVSQLVHGLVISRRENRYRTQRETRMRPYRSDFIRSRRSFLKTTLASGAALAVPAYGQAPAVIPAEPGRPQVTYGLQVGDVT